MCGQKAEFLYVKAGATWSSHWAFTCYPVGVSCMEGVYRSIYCCQVFHINFIVNLTECAFSRRVVVVNVLALYCSAVFKSRLN